MRSFKSEKATISPLLAIIAWSVLLAFPCFCFNLALDSFLKQSFKRRIEMVKPQLTNEMNRFIGEASPEFILQKKLLAFDLRQGFGEAGVAEMNSRLELMRKMDAEKLRKSLADFMGFEIASLFFYGPDSIEVSMSVADEFRDSVKILPGILLKRLLSFLGRQDQKTVIKDGSSQKMLVALLRKDGETRLADNVDFLLQTLFRTITPVNVKAGNLQRTIAANLGKTGPVFYYFSPSTVKDGQKKYNLGGYLAVIRAQDISTRQLVRSALNYGSESIFRRRIIKTGKALSFPDHYANGGLSAIEEDENSLRIRAFVPENFLQHLISSGTILVKNTFKWRKQPLMFEIAAEKRHFQHELYEFKDELKFLLLLVFIFGSVVFLHLSLFGLNFRLSVATKILLAIFFASMLPLSLLFLSYSAFQDYNQESSRQTIRQYLQLRQSILQKQILGKISTYQKENFLIADSLESSPDIQAQKQAFFNWPGREIAVGAYFENVDGSSNYMSFGQTNSDSGLSKTELDLTAALAKSFMQFLYQSPYLEKSTSNIVMALTKGMSSGSTLHDFLRHAGLFTDISRISKHLKFSAIQLFDFEHPRGPIPKSLLILAFSQNALVNRAFTDLKEEVFISEKWGDYLVDQAIFLRDTSGVNPLQEFSSQNLNNADILPIVSLCHKLKRQVVWENDSGTDYRLIVASYEQRWPYISLFRAKRLPVDNAAQRFFYGLSGFVYLAILVILVWQLSRMVFIEPIEKIADGLNQIAAGDLQQRFRVKSGDEFENLCEQLNRMTRGLNEKEKLAMYVSDEVLNIVAGEKESALQPGGELIHAAILFCEPENFEFLTRKLSPAQVVDQLNYFLASCAKICGSFQGTIDKLVDDTVMMVFRQKTDAEAPDLRACKTAFALQKILSAENSSFPYLINCGLSSGRVVSGKIGSKTGKLDFTLIGDAVNMAARVKGFAGKTSTTRIVVTADMVKRIANNVELCRLGEFEIKGKAGKYELFELLKV